MNELDFQRKNLIKSLIESPLWPSIEQDIRLHIMQEMLTAKDTARRDELFMEAQAFDRLVGRLTAIANEVRALKVVSNG